MIDACVERLPTGNWRMWYKDEAHGSHTWAPDSPDLDRWTVTLEVISGPAHEGPTVFRWRNAWWLIIDDWNGLGVFRSPEAEHWTRQTQNILREPGKRSEDGAKGGHADVLVQGDDAWIFYFVHPQRGPGMQAPPSPVPGVEPYATRRTSIEVARLELEGGEMRCRRDEAVPFLLKPGVDNWGG